MKIMQIEFLDTAGWQMTRDDGETTRLEGWDDE